MLLNSEEFSQYANRVCELGSGGLAVDLETTGLSVYHGDKAFLLGVAHRDLGNVSVFLNGPHPTESCRRLLGNPKIKYAAHNAKFELSFFRHQFGCEVAGFIWDTEVFERVLYNNYWKKGDYGLQGCAERRSLSKHRPMLAWLDENGSDQYHRAPVELIIPYVEQDAFLSLLIMEDQIQTFKQWDQSPVKIRPVVQLEMLTTPALFEMESGGLLCDIDYCQRALRFERDRASEAAHRFQTLTGAEFIDSRKCLAPIFTDLGLHFDRTEKGNESFSAASLGSVRDNPIVQAVFTHRDATKRASAYWENFINLACGNRIHPRIHQTGAKTSRMSVRDPACQTWPDDSEPDKDTGWQNPYPIRRAFHAELGCLIVSMDWKGMELGKMADEAGEMGLISDLANGFDPHQAVADEAQVPRGIGKNARFAKLYGAGDKKIASTLGVPLAVAKRVSRVIDEASPRITAYVDELIRHTRQMGWSYNWLGRRYFFDRGFEYKAPNFRIQGGCGEILRIAITDIAAFLKKNARPETRILLPIHDELVFNWHQDDLNLIPAVKQLMISAQRDRKYLTLDVSVSLGPNFHDLEAYENAAAS